jgi:thiamine pyrophosphate-dependent acetolactate synthase large subunit-like protein
VAHRETSAARAPSGSPCRIPVQEGTARGVQIDIAPDMLSLRYPMEVNLVGDGAQTLRALLPLLDRETERSWRGHLEQNVAEWGRVPAARAHTSAPSCRAPGNRHGGTSCRG